MRKSTEPWNVNSLRERFNLINFPEFQREPNVWGRNAKQRLVDSITREFDIASFYFYEHDDESWDCVDGRQRIGAIMSFLGRNPEGEHNGFEYRVLNEIFSEPDHRNAEFDGKTWAEIETIAATGNPEAQRFVRQILDYELTVVMLRDSAAPEEFNLQFARLNLGTIINSGEKLNAMVGELRDLCFEDLASHEFLRSAPIPTRRFSTEQLAAQVVSQVFAIEAGKEDGTEEYARTRHNDLQRLFKENTRLDDDHTAIVARARETMDLLATQLDLLPEMRSRALVLSAFLLAYQLGIDSERGAHSVATFLSEFVGRLRWQIPKGLEVDSEYHYLVEFQRHLTQASVEKPAVRRRAELLRDAYAFWSDTGKLPGDEDYEVAHPGSSPAALRGG